MEKKKKHRVKVGLADQVFNLMNVLIMLVIVGIMLVPIIHVVSVSFSVGSQVQKGGSFL